MKQRKDLVALTFGLIFLGVVIWWLIGRLLDLTIPNAGFLAAAALLLAGVIGLLSTLRRPATDLEADPTEADRAVAENADNDRPETDEGSPATGTDQVDPTIDHPHADPVKVPWHAGADDDLKAERADSGPDGPR